MDVILDFVQSNKRLFDAAYAVSAVVNLLGWGVGAILLFSAWRRRGIKSVSVGPINFQVQEEAVVAAAAAERNWRGPTAKLGVDVSKIRSIIGRAFQPHIFDNLVGKSILWVDDNPSNNRLAVRAIKKLGIDVDQCLSTEQGLAELEKRHFDLIISDMGRGANMQAGYELLAKVRERGSKVPYFIFSSSDRPEFRREAEQRGAQLSTNDMLELMDQVISHLGA